MNRRTVFEGIARCLRGATIILMVALVACVFLQVISRYVLRTSIPWTEELARYVLVYLTFLGSALAVHENSHLKLDLFVELLPRGWHRVFVALSSLLVAVCSVLLIYYGGRFAYLGRNTISPAIEQSMVWVYAVMPLAGVLMLLYAIAWLVEHMGSSGSEGSK